MYIGRRIAWGVLSNSGKTVFLPVLFLTLIGTGYVAEACGADNVSNVHGFNTKPVYYPQFGDPAPKTVPANVGGSGSSIHGIHVPHPRTHVRVARRLGRTIFYGSYGYNSSTGADDGN